MVRETKLDQIKIVNLVLLKLDVSYTDHKIKIVCYIELHDSRTATLSKYDKMQTSSFVWNVRDGIL